MRLDKLALDLRQKEHCLGFCQKFDELILFTKRVKWADCVILGCLNPGFVPFFVENSVFRHSLLSCPVGIGSA